MKRLVFISLIILMATCSFARIWRVNNNPGVSADANNIQAAHDLASSGDTIHIEASVNNYAGFSCTKKLVFIGTGYYLGSNPETQANLVSSKIGVATLQAGAEGTIITGCEFYQYIGIYTSNIVIMRNKLVNINIGSGAASYSNIIIKQNIFAFHGYWDGSFISINTSTMVSNLIVKNNYVYQTAGGTYGLSTWNSNVSGIFENNIIKNSNTVGGVTLANFYVKNNIFIDATFSSTNCTVKNNIGNSTQFGNTNGNQQNVDPALVFVGTADPSPDGQWKLKAGSPAIAAGESGADCGIFGGVDPYVLSGMPAVPAIYYYNTEGAGTQQYIKVKVKSHK